MLRMKDLGCDNQNVSPTPAQRARATRIARELAALARTGFALPGTVADRMTRCGYPGCRCHADPPRLHGPYHQWTRKKDGKTATRILTDDQLADYQPWFDNHRRLRELITELEALSLAIAEAVGCLFLSGLRILIGSSPERMKTSGREDEEILS
jgi:Family of unknown function (DUF6788)